MNWKLGDRNHLDSALYLAMHSLPRYLPFQDWDEWITVKDALYSGDLRDHGRAVQIVELWRSRGKVPHSVDSTAQLVEIGLSSSSSWRSDMELRMLYTTAITRAINGLADTKQQGEHAEAVSKIAASMGIPGWLVGVRHDGTHNELPSLPVLRVAASTMLSWFQDNYWTPQYDLLLQLSNICIPPSLQQSKASVLIPNASLDNPVLSFDSCLEKSSSTFISDSFVPVFVAGCIKIPLKNSDQATLGSQSSLARKTVEKQKKHWLHYLTKVLSVRSAHMHTLVCLLLGTLAQVGSSTVDASIEVSDSDHDSGVELTEWHVELCLLWIHEVLQLIQQVYNLRGGKHNNALPRSSSSASLNGVSLTLSKLQPDELSLYYPLVDTVLSQVEEVMSSRLSGSYLSRCSNRLIVEGVQGVCSDVRSLYLNNMSESDRVLSRENRRTAHEEMEQKTATHTSLNSAVSSSGGGDSVIGGALNDMESFLAGLNKKSGAASGGPKKKQKVVSESSSASGNGTGDATTGMMSTATNTVRYASLTSASAVKSLCVDGVRVCADYPVWSLGLLPGQQTTSNQLLELELIES